MQSWLLPLMPVLSLFAQLGLFFAAGFALLFGVLGVR